MARSVFKFDVMEEDRYVCTMKYEYCPLFPIDDNELKEFIETQRPSLKKRNYHIEF